jgi:serine/threonine-protein kinase RsbT
MRFNVPSVAASLRPADMEDGIAVRVEQDSDIVAARQRGRDLAVQLGFSPGNATLIATAISELARNMLLYAGSGDIVLSQMEREGNRGLMVVAHDQGPGISDVWQALQDGYSTLHRLGLGLPGVKRLMDEFSIETAPGMGTTVVVKKWTR